MREKPPKACWQCREEGILVPFLASREKEVRDIMVTLFDQERAVKTYGRNERAEGREEGIAEGIIKGRAEGIEEGTEQTRLSSIKSLMNNMGMTIEQAMDVLSIPVETRSRLQARLG